VTLEEVMVDAAGQLVGTGIDRQLDGSATWSRAGRAYAMVSGDGSVASFCLDPAVAAAAVRTPDTTASGRGPGWVDFAPAELDDHAIDRATAWLTSAYRRLSPRD
jgi:hypothetical protein